jgi:adenylylsulfate kinase
LATGREASEIADAARRLEGRPPAEVLAWAAERFAPRVAFATGFGAEGCVIVDLIARHELAIEVFTLDTSVLFPETYALWRRLEERYDLTIRAVRPAITLLEQAAQHGDSLWHRDPDRCALRKLEPLRLREHYSAGAAAAPRRPTRSGFIVWFTGLSGAGKSTLAQALCRELEDERPVEVLDGDEVRTYLSKGLGFSREDRDANIRRIGYVARLVARNGVVAITAAISPYAETRAEVRRLAEEDGVPVVEVYAEATIESLTARDVKGLYAKALRGEIEHFTGVSDPYEPPAAAEVVVRTDRESVAESLGRILAALEERGLLEPTPLEAAS